LATEHMEIKTSSFLIATDKRERVNTNTFTVSVRLLHQNSSPFYF